MVDKSELMKMANTTKTIIDLDSRCWQKIGVHLRLKDVINTAEAFNLPNINILKLENNKSNENSKKMRFDRFTKNIQKIFIDMTGGEWYIDIDNWSSSLKILRHFGCLISNLTVDYSNISDHMSIDDTILSTCHESLKRLALSDVDKNTLSGICKPFQNVKVLHIYRGHLSRWLSQFYLWFPKLMELDCEQVSFESPDCIEHYYPHLMVLGISNGNEADLSCITDSNLKVALQINPQLKRLNLSDDAGGRDDFGISLSQKFLFFVDRKLWNLCHLNLTISHLDYEAFIHCGNLNFRYLTTLSLNVKKWSYLSKLPISANRLERLTLESKESCNTVEFHQAYNFIANFVKNNKNINCLSIKSIHNDYDLYGNHVTSLINGLWNLDEFSIEYDWQGAMAPDAIIQFLVNAKIIKFTVHWKVSRLNKPGPDVKQQFIDSFNSCANTYMFDATGWDISFGYYWNSTFISFSKII